MNVRYVVLHHSNTLFGSLEFFNKEAKEKYVSQDLISKNYIGHHYIVNNGYFSHSDLLSKKYNVQYDGFVEEGRSEMTDGVHLNGFNHNSLSIIVVGNLNISEPTTRQWNALSNLVYSKCDQYNLLLSKVIGHREGEIIINNVFTDMCPGKKFDLTAFRRELSKKLQK